MKENMFYLCVITDNKIYCGKKKTKYLFFMEFNTINFNQVRFRTIIRKMKEIYYIGIYIYR